MTTSRGLGRLFLAWFVGDLGKKLTTIKPPTGKRD